MPMYEYKCCGTSVEKLQNYDDPPPQCKKCKKPMTRLISRTSFQLNGGGWYKDGYSKKPKGNS